MPEPASSLPQPEPNEKLVKIFDTEQENEAIVVQGLSNPPASTAT